jgi:hypothetical protein
VEARRHRESDAKDATNAVLSDPRMKTRLAEPGTTPLLYGPKWARVLKFSGIKED